MVTAAPVQIYAVWFTLNTVNSYTAYSSDLDLELLWLVLHSEAINANQAVGCTGFDVIIDIPVVFYLLQGLSPPPLFLLFRLYPPLYCDHASIDQLQARFHHLLHPFIQTLRKWSMPPKVTHWSSAACLCEEFFFKHSFPTGLCVSKWLWTETTNKIFIFYLSSMTFSAIQTSVRVTNANSCIEWIIFPNDLQSTVLSYRQWKCSSFIASVGSSFSKSQLKVYVPTIHQQRCCIEHWLWSWPLLYTVQWAQWKTICFDERLEMNIRLTSLFSLHWTFSK